MGISNTGQQGRDIWQGEPLWPTLNDSEMTYPRLTESATCDVAIVGGGICGTMLAYELSRQRVNVLLVDRKQPGTGATAASTAMLQYELDTPLLHLAERRGHSLALSVYKRWWAALDEIRKMVRRLDDHAGIAKRPSVFIAGSIMNSSELRAECRARTAAGIECAWIDGDTLYKRFGIVGDSAIVSDGALELDPLRLAHALLRTSRRRGVRIYGDTEVAAVSPDRHGVTLTTQHGRQIRCTFAVFATGNEPPYFVDHSLVRSRTTFAVASQPLDPLKLWSERCMMWEASDPYFYARLTPDNRVLMGGEDLGQGRCASAEDLTLASMKLLSKLRLRVPQIRDVAAMHSWCGELSYTEDGLPIIDRVPESSRLAVVMGQGSNGITFSWIAAKVLAGMVLAEPDPSQPLFAMQRFEHGNPRVRAHDTEPVKQAQAPRTDIDVPQPGAKGKHANASS